MHSSFFLPLHCFSWCSCWADSPLDSSPSCPPPLVSRPATASLRVSLSSLLFLSLQRQIYSSRPRRTSISFRSSFSISGWIQNQGSELNNEITLNWRKKTTGGENRSERWMEEGGCRVSGCVDVLMCGYEVLWPSVRTWISDLVTPSVFASLSCCFSPLVCWMVTCCSQTSFYTLLFISFYILSRDGLFNMQSI